MKNRLLISLAFLLLLFAAGCNSRATPLAFTPAPTLSAATPRAEETPALAPAVTVSLEALGIATAAPQPPFQPALRVGLVTNGASDDGGLNQSVYAGLQRSAAESPVAAAVIESLQPDDVTLNLATFAQAGYDLIVVVGEQGAAAAVALAPDYPTSRFVVIDAAVADPPANLHQVLFDDKQLARVAGAWAGLASQSRIVGLVTAADSERAAALVAGYEAGVKQTCAACTVLNTALAPTDAPALGRAAALRQIGEGADVVVGAGGPAGDGAVLGAAQQGVRVIALGADAYAGVFADGTKPGSDALLGSVTKRGDAVLRQFVSDVLADKTLPAVLLMDAQNAGIGLVPAPGVTIPAAVGALVQQ